MCAVDEHAASAALQLLHNFCLEIREGDIRLWQRGVHGMIGGPLWCRPLYFVCSSGPGAGLEYVIWAGAAFLVQA